MRTNAATEADRSVEVVPPVTPVASWRVQDLGIVEHGVLAIRFVDGTEGTVDMRAFLNSDKVVGTVFEALRDATFFSQAELHLGAVEWPGEIDLAPDAMYDEIRANGTWVLN
jgi:Protein of unknown function (DUF2442)